MRYQATSPCLLKSTLKLQQGMFWGCMSASPAIRKHRRKCVITVECHVVPDEDAVSDRKASDLSICRSRPRCQESSERCVTSLGSGGI